MSNTESIVQQWRKAIILGNTMPCFEIELNNGEYLLVDLELVSDSKEIRFSFDTMNLKTWFSGETKILHECLFSVSYADWYGGLDSILEFIYGEVLEGFIIPNNLFKEE